jgi:iron complex outermembrane recepter protein
MKTPPSRAATGKRNTLWLVIASCVILESVSELSFAIEGESNSLRLEEIVITAQKREESLQDVPISVAAFSAKNIKQLGAADTMGLDGYIPNVVLDNGDSDAVKNISIRGISSSARNVGQETGFGVYLDGVYMGRAEAYSQQLPDIERVEVLRGPQGTLFGKNVIAGAMSLTTKKPSDELEGQIMTQVSNNETKRLSGYVSGPLIEDMLAGKVSLSLGESNGYGSNVWDGSDLGSYEYEQVRLQLRATPLEQLEVLFSADYYDKEYIPYLSDVVFSAAGLGVVPGDYTSNEVVAANNKNISYTDNKGVSLQIDYSLADEYQLTSITAYRESGYGPNYQDNARIGLDIFYTLYENNSDYLSQELRLASPKGETFDFVAGVYYINQNSSAITPFIVGNDFEAFTGIPANGATFLTTPEIETTSYAAFVNSNYYFFDDFTLNVGLRYTSEKKDAFFIQQGIMPFIPDIGPITDDYSDNVLSPTLSVSYQLDDDIMMYARFSSGYKSGGFNADNISSTDNFGFEAEFVNNYEVGSKSFFFDRRLRLNTALFYMDYEDLQVTQFDQASNSNYISNAATATIAGLELEMTALPLDGLEISASLGLLDATFDEYIDSFGNDLSGNSLVRAPKTNASLIAEYTIPVSDQFELLIQGDMTYRDEREGLASNDPGSLLESYTLFNAKIALVSERFDIELWGRNLDDKRYTLTRFTRSKLVLGYSESTVSYAPPRSYGISATLKF